MTRVLALALLLLRPEGAAAQSPAWEDIVGAADRAWEGGQITDAERLYATAIMKAESFGESDERLARSLTSLGLLYREQGRYRDAAEAFLNVSTKYETTAKAPEALLRLGQSLAALGEKEAACASLGEVLRKYPRASVGVKQGVDREQKRVRC